jgi:hypothetical protein
VLIIGVTDIVEVELYVLEIRSPGNLLFVDEKLENGNIFSPNLLLIGTVLRTELLD